MTRILATLTLAIGLAAVAGGPPLAAQSDLDEFMSRVLARRDDNWKKLQQYILDERDRFQITGADGRPFWGDERTFTWFIREGFFVRSPVTANGVSIAEVDRRKAEDEFLRRVKARDRDARDGPSAPSPQTSSPGELAPQALGDVLSQTRQPDFMASANFLRFKFEAGRYAFVGREMFERREVYRIEYYPSQLFSHEQNDQDRRNARGQENPREDREAAVERMMNKASLVTLWILPSAHQIVKYTFDNVGLDFLPGAWLFRVTDLTGTMTMGEPFRDVWLPREVDMRAGALIAAGAFEVRYRAQYENYREAATAGRVIFPPGQ